MSGGGDTNPAANEENLLDDLLRPSFHDEDEHLFGNAGNDVKNEDDDDGSSTKMVGPSQSFCTKSPAIFFSLSWILFPSGIFKTLFFPLNLFFCESALEPARVFAANVVACFTFLSFYLS